MKCVLALFALIALACAAQDAPSRGKQPTVFISGNGATFVSGGTTGKHDETMEMARLMLKRCPEISLTVKDSDPVPDYFLELNREEEYGFIVRSAISQIILLRGSDQAVLWSDKKGTVAKAVREGCKAIVADWKQQRSDAPSVPQPAAIPAPAAAPAPRANANAQASSKDKDKQWWEATNPPPK